ncbi:Lrp/AsnC family transcriptional regulator [Pseudogracilibacillus auburnensis]|uniref:Lrp/AsnC family transcriptional regulator n=1 Tax=Pseudogracilibacillus auburnensis TaxID=1494959 RepID=UPI000D753326|nr:Lrp/AsnC family transcriptional regulator [Pseudogracilibacillus auburnensis]MBO1003327.1 Lrp/AsnC family transcriptional regulator [Pseudogracilibacillus auburnensis]
MDSLTNKELDEIDKLLLRTMQSDAGLSNVDLAKKVNLSPPATHGRIKRLENEGYINNYVTILDREKLGFDLLCFIYVKTSIHQTEQLEAFEGAIISMTEVLECHHITGEYDFLLKVVLKDSKDLKNFIGNKLSSHGSISGIQTSLSYEEVKSTTALPF